MERRLGCDPATMDENGDLYVPIFHETPEYAPSGVKARIPRFLWKSPEVVVATSLAGLEQGEVVCIPGWTTRIFVAISRVGVTRLVGRFLLRWFGRPAYTPEA